MRKNFMLSASIGAMTAAERAKGRYMRAPDGHGEADPFAELNAEGGEVEVGKSQIESNAPDDEPAPEEKPRRGRPPKEKAPAAAPAENTDENGENGEGEEGNEEEQQEEKPAKKPRQPSERIKELTARNRSQDRVIKELTSRLDALEKGGLPDNRNSGNNRGGNSAPDPTDTAKYPLGHLDDRYIEDKLEYLAEVKAGERADAALQRQQGEAQQREAQQQHEALLERVDDLASRGSELYDDFQESVVDAGMRGDWKLEQATFEAAYEADNGAQILYELSQDPKEAARVAALSPFKQTKFVADRDAEISSKSKPRTRPGAGEPPRTRTNGANSSHRINPATDNLDDFEKAWAADAKGR